MITLSRFSRIGLAALALIFSASLGLASGDHKFKSTPTLQTEAATMIKLFELYHFNRANVHSSDYSEVIPDYMQALDGQHLFFLGVDKTYYTTKYNGATVYSKVAYNGDIDPAYEIFETYQKRVKDRINWIYATLKDPIDLNGNETFAPDRTKAEWPETAPDSDDLWRRRLKYELISELLSQKEEKAEKKDTAVAPKDTTKELDKTKVVQTLTTDQGKTVTKAEVTVNASKANEEIAQASAPKLSPRDQAIETVRKRYERMLKNLDDIESGDLAELYLTSIASLYDPHSNYFSADSYDEFSISMKLQLFGIGAMLRLKDDYCTIEELSLIHI